MCDTGYYGYENVNTMVHAAIGYLTADLAGSKTPISTALANGVNAYAVEAIKKDKNLKAYFEDNPALLRLVSIGIGAGIGGLTGEGNTDAWSGASSAQNATRWNEHGRFSPAKAQKILNTPLSEDVNGNKVVTFYDYSIQSIVEVPVGDITTLDNLYLKESGGFSYKGISFAGTIIIDQSGIYGGVDGSLGYSPKDENGGLLSPGFNIVVGSIKTTGNEDVTKNKFREDVFRNMTTIGSGAFYGIGGVHYTVEKNPNITLDEVGFNNMVPQVIVYNRTPIIFKIMDFPDLNKKIFEQKKSGKDKK